MDFQFLHASLRNNFMRDLRKNKVIKNLRRELMTKEKIIKGLITKLKYAKVLSQESCSSIINNVNITHKFIIFGPEK